MLKKFTLMQKLRNKLKIKGNLDLEISKNAKLVGCTLISKGNNKLYIDERSVLRNVEIEIIGDNSSIYIGKDCMIGDNCYISAKEGATLRIEDSCALARNIKVMTSDGHPIYQDKKRINEAKDITLQNSVWIADNVTILKGVNIGSGSVVGINSTLTKSIPLNSIAVGNPAKVVKEGIEWAM
jgi:acetyltransferase-like isoleucine patch superfamily enzyme